METAQKGETSRAKFLFFWRGLPFFLMAWRNLPFLLAACASVTDAFAPVCRVSLSMSAQHRNSASSLHISRRRAIATVPGVAGALVLPSIGRAEISLPPGLVPGGEEAAEAASIGRAYEAMQWPAALQPNSVLPVGDKLKLPAIGFGM